MRKKISKSILLVFGAILMLMSLSNETSERFRGVSAAAMGNFWVPAAYFKGTVATFFGHFFSQTPDQATTVQKLQLKNQQLESRLKKIESLINKSGDNFFEKNEEFTLAEVVYRSPSTWNSSLWVKVGSKDQKRIAKNSPVVLGDSVVGVVDYVGTNQSRIRLITDSGLRPSVRVKRIIDQKIRLLAKGELHGSSQPLWRSDAQILHGIGFNYDFPDDEGPARDLRTGKPLNGSKTPSFPLIKVDDLLVTSGLDGVFPEGLKVATITRVKSLKEGDYYFEIEAKPVLENLHDLSFVFILPPVGYDPSDQPPALGW